MYIRRSSKIDTSFGFDPVFLFLLILAFLFRYFYLSVTNFSIESDEAIVGLMAKHMFEGGAYPTFYYGQHYMGSLEPILVSYIYNFTGVTNFGLKFIPLLFSTLCIYPVYRLAQIVGGKFAGRIAALLYCFPSQMFLLWSLKARGGFIEIVFISAIVILLSVKFLIDEKPNVLKIIPVGLAAGLGWWTNNQIIFAMAACGFFLLFKMMRQGVGYFFRSVFFGVTSFIIGGMPFWVYNFQNDWVSFEKFSSSSDNNFWHYLHGLYINGLPILLGAKRDWHTETLFKFSAHLSYLMFFIASVLILFNYFNLDRRRVPVKLLYALIFFACLIFSLSSFGSLNLEPRYLLPVYISWCCILGIGFSFVKNKIVRSTLVSIPLFMNVYSAYDGNFIVAGEPYVFKQERVSRDHTDLINWLDSHNINVVRTDYWIGYRLAFETQERIKFVIFDEPVEARIPEYQKLYSPKNTLVLTPKQGAIVKRALEFLNITYSETIQSKYVVLYDFKDPLENLQKVEPKIHEMDSSYGKETLGSIFDGNLETRYASGKAQSPDMWVEFSFIKPIKLSAVEYEVGEYIRDIPKSLRIVITDSADREHEICSQDKYHLIKYMLGQKFDFVLKFPPVFVKKIRFEQLGKDAKYDWSIAELGLYR